MFPEFKVSEDIQLKPISKDDDVNLWPFVSDPEISQDMSWQAHKDIKETRMFIENTLKSMNQGKSITWCIYFKGELCGLFSLISILRTHRSLTYDRGEIAYWIGKEYRGKGIMAKSGIKVLEYAFNVLHLNKIVVGHHQNNGNSKNLILKLGFKFTYFEEEVFKKNNVWIDCSFYELKSKEFIKAFYE